MRPPVDRWWEMKDANFQKEMVRNKVIINAPPSYFEKLEELKNRNLY
jgi:hypothetical protein